MSRNWLTIVGLVMVIMLAGCATTGAPGEQGEDMEAASGSVAADDMAFDMTPHEREGFVLIEEDGRLWVFHEGSADLEKFRAEGEPAKQVIRPVSGVNGVTLKSTESETLDEYITSIPGWVTIMEDGRLWVFRAGSEGLEKFLAEGEPAKQVVRPLAGPYGLTIKGLEAEELDAYMVAWEAR